MDDFALDPSLRLWVPLYRKNGTVFTSDDAQGIACTRVGAFWTPRGDSLDGIDDHIDCGIIDISGYKGITIIVVINRRELVKRVMPIGSGYPPFQFNWWGDGHLSWEVEIDGVYRDLLISGPKTRQPNKTYMLAVSHDLASGVCHSCVDGEMETSGVQAGTAYTGGGGERDNRESFILDGHL